MGYGIAFVAHKVSTDPKYCTHDSPDDGFMERSVCSYQVLRDRHGPHRKIERKLPRCALFNVWLEVEPGKGCVRCNQCKVACGEMEAGFPPKLTK